MLRIACWVGEFANLQAKYNVESYTELMVTITANPVIKQYCKAIIKGKTKQDQIGDGPAKA